MIKHTRTNVEIETELLERFKAFFPQHGAIKWFVNAVFQRFVENHAQDVDNEITQAVALAVKDLEETTGEPL